MLAGVGGNTIAQAKQNLTYDEALKWFDFLNRKGTVNLGSRMEWGFALLATVMSNAHGGKSKMRDFMPFTRQEEEDVSIESAFLMLKAASRKEA